MKFGPEPTADCAGAILAHGYRLGKKGALKKGHVLGDEDLALLIAEGISEITVARLESGDVGEDEGARAIADACAGVGLRTGPEATGRVNLYAQEAGLLAYEPERLREVNSMSEAITVSALSPLTRVAKGQLAATAKIIPLGLPGDIVDQCATAASRTSSLFSVTPFQPMRVGLLQTILPNATDKLLNKTRDVLGRRAAALGSEITAELRTPHESDAVAAALRKLVDDGSQLILVLGASATTDRRDVVPLGVVAAGGTITHFGMPVDPGNLLVLCAFEAVPILVLPGSARSPRRGGNDWMWERLAAGMQITSEDIMALGAGGLLKEIPTRPLPREQATLVDLPDRTGKDLPKKSVAGILLAAGQSRRMGPVNKLLAEVDGKAMVARAAAAMIGAGCEPVIVVLGYEADAVRRALADYDVTFVENRDYADGLSTSLRTGLEAAPEQADGVLIGLGDMPRLASSHLTILIETFRRLDDEAICVPVWAGKRGNPVLWGRAYFDEMTELEGDSGAKHLIGQHGPDVHEVDMQDDAIFQDIDTATDLAAVRRGDKPKPAKSS